MIDAGFFSEFDFFLFVFVYLLFCSNHIIFHSQKQFDFVPFSKFESINVAANPNNTVVDIVCICTDVG